MTLRNSSIHATGPHCAIRLDSIATTTDNDYVAKTGTLTFGPGETTKTIPIEVKGEARRRLARRSTSTCSARHRHDPERRLKCNRFSPPADAMTTRGRCAARANCFADVLQHSRAHKGSAVYRQGALIGIMSKPDRYSSRTRSTMTGNPKPQKDFL
jgi:hypothetical protein